MDTTATTYTQAGNYPNQWVVDDSSQEYPSRPEEIFGIYQLVKNPNYQIGNDAANQAARAAPCLIETSNPNEIMIGIDKIILVPTAFTRPVDPYFVNPASLPSVNLVSFARPPQSLVYNDGGFIDGIKVDATLYMVYMTGYITYTVPSDAVASATLGAPPNPAEDISCTCLGSAPLTISTAPTVKYTLVVASEPATTARPSNLFYTIYQGQGGGIPPFASSWKPLMSVSTAQAIANGNGQVSIVQVSDTSVLLFQRSRSEILQVYVCTLDINNTNLTLSDPAGAIANGILSLKDATVMPSVLQAYSTRFGLQFPDGADYNLIYDTWFSVLYQPSNGAFASPGYHIFASPYTFTSSIIHLWYPATTAAPFIDETKGTCVGVYGTVPLSIPPTNPPSTTPPPMHIITGNLGSKLDFVVDSVTYGGSDPVYLEVKVNQASMTYSVREWGKYASGFVAPSGSLAAVSTDVRNVPITLSDGSTCTLNLHWTGTTVAGVAGTVNPNTVVDGDFWIFEVQPYSIANMTSGTLNNGAGVLALDVSQSHLPRDSSFSCSFTLTYIAPATPAGFGALTVANSKNASGDQSAKNLIIPNGTSPLNASSQITLSPSTANIVVTLAATPADQDSWSITITNGDVSNPVSGIPNTGDWAYPTVSGSYTGATQSRVSVACYKIDNVNNSPATLHFTYNEDGGIDKDFTLSVQTKTNSDGTQVITGWSTAMLDNGLTFGFDNLSGTPATTDHWAFDVTPSVALLEVIGQRPVAMFTSSAQNPQSAWLVAPTKSAGGRILQLQVPLQPPTAGKSNVPNPAIAGLLPLRTTLEPYLGLVGGVPTLSFKGLKTSGVSWSAAIQKEVPTDSTNQLAYGLLGYLKEDYRPSHSGPYYTTALGSQGITDSSTINMWSTFAVSDVLAEPHLPSDFASELPTPGWTADPLSTTPPQYRPTAWMALFPQYRFHIGQVHVASDLSLNFSLDPSATASALKTRILTGSGRQVLYEDFFANNMIPAVNPDVYSQWKSAVSEGLSVDSRKQWLQDGSGNSINPFTNNDFLQVSWDPTWTTDADYPKVAKYILQLSVLRQLWDSPPGWTVNTDEGRNVPNYWKFRIGGPVADQFLNTAFASPAYMNKRTTLQNQLLPQYFSTNPLFPAAFGSAAAAFAAVLTDPRMEPSFNQLTDRARTKLINAMVQQVSTSGLALNRTVLSYLANRSIVQNPSPINSNIVSEIPITVTPKSDGSLPATWELNLARFAGPLMYVVVKRAWRNDNDDS
ncbi:hypothetical protein SISNIDRAFT_136227 [Sistotremastrum niveocremeum HHB9708]|uniref:Uncharacterized protein n=1 Tax=Sistotremastrum niveocremeum HHB9708 TaxID=1314777 RepID=A0A164ZYX3_9AGAM|nr:hypothetical protein SISNIDRAFT_136227 [Sistotremastrum niveocremeum HHB9708]